MDGHLRDRFDEAVAADPGVMPGALVTAAMAEGGRMRRRRNGLSAVGAAAVLVVAAGGLAVVNRSPESAPPPVTIAAAMMPASAPLCSPEPDDGDATDLAVFLATEATDGQRAEVGAAVRDDARVAVAVFEDHQAAYQRFARLWADSPDFVAAVSADQLPESFRLRLVSAKQDAAVRARFAAMPGVAQVIGHTCPKDAPVGGAAPVTDTSTVTPALAPAPAVWSRARRRAKETRDEEFTAFVEASGTRLRRSAYLMCRDWHLAQDLTQHTLAKMYAVWDRIRTNASLEAYSRRVLMNVVFDQQRRRSGSEIVLADLPDRPDAGASGVPELRVTLVDALARLEVRDRAVLVLRHAEDHSVETVATILGLSVSAVKMRNARALERLRAQLGEDFLDR